MLVAQLTDLHVVAPGRRAYGMVDTARCLATAVRRLLALDPRPDLVLVTGDLAYDGAPAEYRHLLELLRPLPTPWRVIPGNHDRRAALRAILPVQHCPAGDVVERLCWCEDHGPLRVVGLDSLVESESHGELDPAQLGWLDARLSEAPHRPSLVLLHHPPLPTGIAHMDRIGLREPAGLGAVLSRHPQVERLLCGHVHRPIQWRWAGTLVSVAPATAHQVALDLRPDGPAAFTLEAPAMHLHLWRSDVGIVTHEVPVADPGPLHPFADG